MKKILMIAYYYPPVAGGGVQRTSKFAKYLCRFGWEPIILTVKEGYDYYRDDSLNKDIVQDISVYRSFSIEPMKWIRKWLKKRVDRRTLAKENTILKQGEVKKHPWLLKVKESIFIPDGEIGWLPFAVLKGWHIIRKENIDLIYSTSCPYTDHLIAYFLKRLTRKPWIADFRDPWSHSLKAPQIRFRKWIDRKLEKLVLSSTDRTVTVTKPIENEFKAIYPYGQYVTITNGYDEDDFHNIDRQKKSIQKWNITYTGILFRENSPNTFLLALSHLLKEKPALSDNMVVRFVGQLDNPGEMDNYHYLKSLNLGSVIELIPYQSHEVSIQYALSADVLLLIVNDGPYREGVMTSKVFEYLRCQKPILAVVPPNGVAADVVLRTNSGVVVHPEAIDDIKKAMLSLYQMYQKDRIKESFGFEGIDQYSRYELTKKLVQQCNDFVP